MEFSKKSDVDDYVISISGFTVGILIKKENWKKSISDV